MNDIMHPNSNERDADFPHAPEGWTRDTATAAAAQDGLEMGDEHWELVKSLQEYFARHEGKPMHSRELTDALDEHFHARGGMKHLYRLCPGGPVTQGCKMAGLEAPAGSNDKGFGSVR